MPRLVAPAACLAAVLAFAPPAAFAAGVPLDSVLSRHAVPERLRAALAEWADERTASDPEASGEALYWAGESWFRAGARDSAILAWERAWARRRGGLEGDALIEARLDRKGPDDLDRARTLIAARIDQSKITSEVDLAYTYGRLAWWQVLSGRPDSAVTLFHRHERRLLAPGNPLEWTWLYRIARAEAANNDAMAALERLMPLAARSLLKDRPLLDLIADLSPGGAERAMPILRNELRILLEDRAVQLASLGGRERLFRAADDFPVSGIQVTPPGKGRRRAAVGLLNPDEPLEGWDSLAVSLRRSNVALILVEARGSGRSKDVDIPSPEAWRGNERFVEGLITSDLSVAIRALADSVPIDTSRVLLIAGRGGATAAIEAAARDPRFHALLLVSPDPSPVDRGRAIAALDGRRMPVYIANASTDVNLYWMSVSDLLLHASEQGVSRISDSKHMGPGIMLFRNDPEAYPRFRRWMDEVWARPAPKSGARPTRSPQG